MKLLQFINRKSFMPAWAGKFLATVVLGVVFAHCNTGQTIKPRKKVITDTSITPQNAVVAKFLDSNFIKVFLADKGLPQDDSADISDFYRARNYQYAWFDSLGLTEQGKGFISLYRNFRSIYNDTTLQDAPLDSTIDRLMEDSTLIKSVSANLPGAELGITSMFFKYSASAYTGNSKVDPVSLGWFIPKTKINIRAFLDSVTSSSHVKINDFEPVHPMFTPLHQYLEKYILIEKNHGWPLIAFKQNSYKEGDSAMEIGMLKRRLQLVEDFAVTDSGDVFTAATTAAVKSFQHRYGFKEDGIVSKKLMAELNKPVTDRIKQLIVNIERIRWVPKPGSGRYLVANIPAFKLYAFDSGKLQFAMNVVVGSQAHNTTIFSDRMKTVVFAPYWNVPYSIVKNEMRGKPASYFTRNNMEITGKYTDGLPQVRQKPGDRNALGRVKFLFPNSYSIYFHDTPSKGLFQQDYRAASHGCIRLGEPEKLANWVLAKDAGWSADSVRKSLQLTKEKYVQLKTPIPVFIGYFTAWVDQQGKLNFRDDVYGHDKKMIEKLIAR